VDSAPGSCALSVAESGAKPQSPPPFQAKWCLLETGAMGGAPLRWGGLSSSRLRGVLGGQLGLVFITVSPKSGRS